MIAKFEDKLEITIKNGNVKQCNCEYSIFPQNTADTKKNSNMILFNALNNR